MFAEGAAPARRARRRRRHRPLAGSAARRARAWCARPCARAGAEAFPGRHAYMPNLGYPELRERAAEDVDAPGVTAACIAMTGGAAGAMCLALRAFLDAGDEVVGIAPYFPEFRAVLRDRRPRLHPGARRRRPASASTSTRWWRALTDRTAALIINTPSNPSGHVIEHDEMAAIVDVHRAPQPPHRPAHPAHRRRGVPQPRVRAGAARRAVRVLRAHRAGPVLLQGHGAGRRAHRLPGAAPLAGRRADRPRPGELHARAGHGQRAGDRAARAAPPRLVEHRRRPVPRPPRPRPRRRASAPASTSPSRRAASSCGSAAPGRTRSPTSARSPSGACW